MRKKAINKYMISEKIPNENQSSEPTGAAKFSSEKNVKKDSIK